jgi:hypothetical protein
MPPATTSTTRDDYFGFRARLLGEARNRLLTGTELTTAGRLIYGQPEGLSLYGIPSPLMAALGLRLLGRTTIECSVDAYLRPVADALAAETIERDCAFVADLFCGSGNFGFHLGLRLGKPVYASELDPLVHAATQHNFDVLGIDTALSLTDYRDLLGTLPVRGDGDVYIVEPPWGPAFTADGLDLTRTAPPVPEIVDDIRQSRSGAPCLVAIKTNDQIAGDSLSRSFADARHLASITPIPVLPRGANMDFHLYSLGEH